MVRLGFGIDWIPGPELESFFFLDGVYSVFWDFLLDTLPGDCGALQTPSEHLLLASHYLLGFFNLILLDLTFYNG